MTAREAAISLLSEYGCDLDCYRNDLPNAIKDITYLVENGRSFVISVEELANALVEVGNEQPIIPVMHKPYLMICDMDHSIDGVEYDTLEDALCSAEETYHAWMQDEYSGWTWDKNLVAHPTPEQIRSWNYMIDNCCCYVVEYDPEMGEYGDVDSAVFLSDEKLDEIGWKEIPEDNTDDAPILIPPGETLKEVLEDRGISTTDFAEAAGLTADAVEAILEGSREITEEIAEEFEETIGVPASFWVNLQKNFDRECEEAGVERD